MNKFFWVILLAAFASGCGNQSITEVEETFEDGTKKTVKTYEKINGDTVLKAEKRYYDNGKLKIEGSYKDGKRSGKWVSYYRNGNVWAEATYRDGKEYGKKTVYYENGKVYYTGEMKDGKRVGKWRFTDIAGNTSTIDYDKKND